VKKPLQQSLITLPSFGWLTFFFLVPACIVYMFAFKRADITGAILPGWSLDSLKTLLDKQSLALTWRTLWLSLVTTAGGLCLAIPMSYYMATRTPSNQRRLVLFVMIPLWSSFIVRIFAWKIVLHPEGIVKMLLVTCGLSKPNTPLLYNDLAVLIVMIYSYFPFAVLPLYSAASKFDFSLFEAAMDLGATKRRSFFTVYLPAMIPAILTAGLMVLIPAAGAYVIPEVVGGSGSEMLGNTIARRIFLDRNLPVASALSLLLSLVVFIPAVIIALWHSGPQARGGENR